MTHNPGDTVKIRRGPLSGMEIKLKRHDTANKAWHGHIEGGNPGEVLVYDYELAETVERKKKEVKRG